MGMHNTLKALADPIRREILNLLKSGKMSAGEITEHFDVTGASISRHLSVLKEAELIRDRRDGKFIIYELNASVLEEICCCCFISISLAFSLASLIILEASKLASSIILFKITSSSKALSPFIILHLHHCKLRMK